LTKKLTADKLAEHTAQHSAHLPIARFLSR
jgi:hypothetical protein